VPPPHGGHALSEQAEAAVKAGEAGWQWDKGVCRFCGNRLRHHGRHQDGRIVATKGDPDAR